MCCCGTDKDETCGWPPRTIRATIALVTILLTFPSATAISIIFIIRGQYSLGLGIISAMMNIVSLIIGHYFGSRTASTQTKSKKKESTPILSGLNA